jgi:hypothetical protein
MVLAGIGPCPPDGPLIDKTLPLRDDLGQHRQRSARPGHLTYPTPSVRNEQQRACRCGVGGLE